MSRSPEDEPIDAEVVDESAAVALPSPMTVTESIAPDYTEGGVPTFDYVRDQIEGRIATSIGTAELTSDTPQAASVDDQFAARERAGRDRLAEIRRAMREE
jgi:phage shock protein A